MDSFTEIPVNSNNNNSEPISENVEPVLYEVGSNFHSILISCVLPTTDGATPRVGNEGTRHIAALDRAGVATPTLGPRQTALVGAEHVAGPVGAAVRVAGIDDGAAPAGSVVEGIAAIQCQ